MLLDLYRFWIGHERDYEIIASSGTFDAESAKRNQFFQTSL